MEGLTICNCFVVKLLLFCTMVCLTSVCVWRQYNYIILMCGSYLYFVPCFFFFFKYYWLELLYTIIYLLLLQQLWVVNPQSSTCIFMMKTLHCCNLLSPQTKAFLLINKFNVKNMYSIVLLLVSIILSVSSKFWVIRSDWDMHHIPLMLLYKREDNAGAMCIQTLDNN